MFIIGATQSYNLRSGLAAINNAETSLIITNYTAVNLNLNHSLFLTVRIVTS